MLEFKVVVEQAHTRAFTDANGSKSTYTMSDELEAEFSDWEQLMVFVNSVMAGCKDVGILVRVEKGGEK